MVPDGAAWHAALRIGFVPAGRTAAVRGHYSHKPEAYRGSSRATRFPTRQGDRFGLIPRVFAGLTPPGPSPADGPRPFPSTPFSRTTAMITTTGPPTCDSAG